MYFYTLKDIHTHLMMSRAPCVKNARSYGYEKNE